MPMSVAELHTETLPAVAVAVGSTSSGEAIRYFVVSLAALALDAGLLWIGTGFTAVPVWLSGAIAYGAGLVLVYVLSIRWVFKERRLHDPRGEFLVFAVLGLVGLVLNSTTLAVATGLGIALPLAKVLSAGIGFTANFVSRKVLLFSGRTP